VSGHMKSGVTFDQAHSQKLKRLLEDPTPEGRKKAVEFAMFCAGIVDSLYHQLKITNPRMVAGTKGFGIPADGK